MNPKNIFLTLFICLQLSFLAQTNGVYNAIANGNNRPISPPLGVMNGNGSNVTSYTASACGLNYTQATVRLTQKPFNLQVSSAVQPATLAISGIPPCASVLKAFLYTILSGNGAAVTASITNPVATSASFPMMTIGNDIDLCWGYVGTYSYRADVTAIINGNGNYILSGLPTGTPNDAAGALLFIIYSDASQLYTGNILIGDGCQVITGNGYSGSALAGFSVCGTPSLTNSFMITADLQGVGNSSVNFNGATNAAVSCNFTKLAATDQAWDYITAPGAPVVPGQTVANFGLINGGGDCLAIGMVGVYYRSSCLTCNGPVLGQPFTINASSTGSCGGMGSATVSVSGGSGQYYYSWLGTAQTTSVVTGLNTGNYTVYVTDLASCNTASTQVSIPLQFSGLVNNSIQQPCASVNTGTASILLAGGSGSQSYLWTGPNGAQTASIATGLSAGNYTVLVTDAVTSCTINQTFTLAPPPVQLGVFITAGSPSACAGGSISFTASAYGGTIGPPPFYTYSWSPGPMGAIYTASTAVAANYIYTVTAIDANSCTATATVPAAFKPNPPLVVANIAICPTQTGMLSASGANSYTWSNNTNLTTLADNPLMTTAYTVTGTAQGCTTSATASIIVNPVPVPTLTTNGPICSGNPLNLYGSGGSIYSWSGPFGFVSTAQNPQIYPSAVNNSGLYTVTVTAVNLCTASASMGFTVYQTPALTISSNAFCTTQTLSFLPYAPTAVSFTWTGPGGFTSSLLNPSINNPPVSASGNYSVTVTSAEGCTNNATANITVVDMPVISFTSDSPKCQGQTLNFNSSANTGGLVYGWNGPNGFSSPLQNPAIFNTIPAASGIYTLTVTAGPCVARATNTVTIYPGSFPLIISNGLVCETKSLSLSVNTTYSAYSWSGPLNYTNATQGFVINNAQTIHSGVYSVVVTDNNNCQGSTSVSVTIEPNPVLTVTGADVCFGGLAVISASGAAGYVWTGPGGFTAFTQQATIPAALNSTPLTYYVMGTGLNTCTSVASVEVSTHALPIASASVTPRTCVNSEIYFKGVGHGVFFWSGPLDFTHPQQSFSVIATNEGMTGTYTLTVTDSLGCRGTAYASLLVDPIPQGGLLSSNKQNCVPFCSDFKLVAIGSPVVTSQWQVNSQTFNSETFNYCFTTAGNYTVRGNFTNEASCTSTVLFVVNAYAPPVANYSFFPQLPVENEEVQFTSTSKSPDLANWSWYFSQNDAYPENSPLVSHVFSDAGNYAVALVIKNKWGCSDTIVEAILVDEDFFIFLPNAFTPNEDNLNETFAAVGRGIKTYSMEIYDRWGEKLFETNNIFTGWDGSYKGKFCKDDVYVWRVLATSMKGKEKKMTGSVFLYR